MERITPSLTNILGAAPEYGPTKELDGGYRCTTLKGACCPFKGEQHSSGNPVYITEAPDGSVRLKCFSQKCKGKIKNVVSRKPQPFNFVGLEKKE